MQNIFQRLAACLILSLSAILASAQSAPAADEFDTARDAALAAAQAGPRDITLGDQAVLRLPAGYSFVPQAPAAALMRAMGNHTGEGYLGMIIGERIDGFVSVNFDKAGYIKDDEARDWNADDMLKNLREGTEETNKERAQRGLPQIEVLGWVQKPTYAADTHRLVWSISARDKGAPADAKQGVNYNTYLLGREGYLSLNLVTGLDVVDAEKPQAHALLAAVSFKDGKRYQDFNASTDHVAEYGLAALVGGLAVKKLGLLAMAGVFLAKMWKLAALAVFGVGAAIRKFFGGRQKENDQA